MAMAHHAIQMNKNSYSYEPNFTDSKLGQLLK